ncbi:hypothetical protein J6590_012406 [Homalodisca vitripennis]|nr:hypothetical protein J6590_012406 [Homalodisca vitripennis]
MREHLKDLRKSLLNYSKTDFGQTLQRKGRRDIGRQLPARITRPACPAPLQLTLSRPRDHHGQTIQKASGPQLNMLLSEYGAEVKQPQSPRVHVQRDNLMMQFIMSRNRVGSPQSDYPESFRTTIEHAPLGL